MHGQGRGQDRSCGLGSALLLGALIGLAACAPAAPAAGEGIEAGKAPPPPVDLELVRQLGKTHQQYVDALLLCGGPNARDWQEARKRLELIQPYRVFDEDPELIRKFRGGDEVARLELARRGLVLDALMVFPKGYDRKKWEDAHKVLMDAGQPGQILLSTTLVEILMNGQFRDLWDHVRTALVETGPVALETVAGWARALAEATPAQTAVYRIDDLTQAAMALIWFGEKGRSALEEYVASPKPNVRRACARAIGEARHLPSAPALVRMVGEDRDWTVRTSAAEALGRMTGAKAAAGRALVDRLKKGDDRIVLRATIEAMGTLKYEEAVPVLMTVLDHPNVEMANLAMMSLYHITGERLTRKDQWLQWYQTAYPAWKARPRNP